MSSEPRSPAEDTQRDLERRALRGVRGLVDTLDTIDQADRRKQKKLFAVIVVGALIGVAILAGVVMFVSSKSSSSPTIVIPAPVSK